MQKGIFFVDQLPPVMGIYDPSENWNGHAVPYFDEATARAIVEILDHVKDTSEEGYFIEWKEDAANPDLMKWDGTATATYVAEIKPIQHEGKNYYCIHGNYFAWQVIEQEFNSNDVYDVLLHCCLYAIRTGEAIRAGVQWAGMDRETNDMFEIWIDGHTLETGPIDVYYSEKEAKQDLKKMCEYCDAIEED